jgi:two-component system response regulator PilR (NtrC family)
MPLPLQAKLLRFLEEKKIRPIGSGSETEVDVRVITATNKPLQDLLTKGKFREDLFYRLATFEIKLPSLRERREDIPLLIDHFVKFFSKKFQKKISRIYPAFVDYIIQHELRGNVRELKNIIEREVILSENEHLQFTSYQTLPYQSNIIADIPETGMNLGEYLSGIERELLRKSLIKANGVKTKAAELLGLSFREFRYKLSKYKDSGFRIQDSEKE